MLLTLFIIITSITLLLILTLVSYIISESSSLSREESSTYECGFEHYSHSRLPFSIRYFMLTIIFLIFDMEIMFLFLVPSSFFITVNLITYILVVLVFIVILLLGLLYEWLDGSLNWVM